MTQDGMTPHECRKYLAAFADGELDVEQNLKVLEQMAMDPTNTRRVLHQQQLRKACAKAMDRPDDQCPQTLRDQIAARPTDPEALPHATSPRADKQTPGQTPGSPRKFPLPPRHPHPHPRPAVLARIRPALARWAPTAVAAVLTIGALVALYQIDAPQAQATIVSPIQYSLFQSRHKTCSADTRQLKPGIASPKHVTALPGTIDDYFDDTAGQIDRGLDLTVLGYHFERVGLCAIPGKNAVHIVYQSPDTDQSLSLWIKPDTAPIPLTPGMLYTASTADDAQPVLIWKRHGRVYYLVGDAPAPTRQAAALLRHTHPPPEVSPGSDPGK